MAGTLPKTGFPNEAEGFMGDGTGAAFADIVFLLLAFLVSIFSLNAAVGLPETRAENRAAAEAGAVPLKVEIRNGEYFLNIEGQSYHIGEAPALAQALRRLADGQPELAVELRAEATTPFIVIRSVMAAAQEAGLNSISVIANQQSR